MSRMRGIFPLFLATAFGVANGVWVFAPAFKEQQQEKEQRAKKVWVQSILYNVLIGNRKALQVTNPSESGQEEALRSAEAAASRSAATESTLRPASSYTWWSNMSLWSKRSQRTSGISENKPAKPNIKD